MHRRSIILLVGIVCAACDGESPVAPTDPTDVTLGETTFVVTVNPTVNDANAVTVADPGATRDGVLVLDDELSVGGTTGVEGIVVVAPVDAGERTVSLSGEGIDAAVMETIADGDLVDLAIAAEGSSAESMVSVIHAFAGRTLVEITPEMGIDAVNAALATSDTIVLLRGGVYVGDLVFGGSRVTLFGEGTGGGEVTIDGDVIVGGSDNGLRGMHVTGSIEVSGSGGAIVYSRIDGLTRVSGSDVVLLENAFCGEVALGGAGITALGNRGLAPLAVPDDC